MKATLDWKHHTGGRPTAKATFTVPAGDVKLQATLTEASLLNEVPSLEGVVLGLEKPDALAVHYHPLQRDCHFKFMNTVRVLEKPLKLTYKHEWCKKSKTELHGSLEWDDDNQVSTNCTFVSRSIDKCKMKYTHKHNKGLTTVKPSYEVVQNCWDLSVSQKIYDINTLKASFKSSNNNVGLKWSLASKNNGTFKTKYQTLCKILEFKWLLDSKPLGGCFELKASLNLGEELKAPSVTAKATFNFEI